MSVKPVNRMSTSRLTLTNNRFSWTRLNAFSSLPTALALNFYCQGQTLFDGWGEKDNAGLGRLVSMFLDSVETRADDVANWPSVSFQSISIRMANLWGPSLLTV
jgi:hypothetical protein